MEITLTPEQERIVRRGMAGGRYSSPEDLVGDALASWIERLAESGDATDAEDATHRRYVHGLNEAVKEARRELERGDYQDYNAGELDALFENIQESGAAGS